MITSKGWGLFLARELPDLNYFHADKDSPLYSKLKNLIAKSLGLPGAIKALLRAAAAEAAFIHDSYAEGGDVDEVNLVIMGNTPTVLKGLRDLENKVWQQDKLYIDR